MRPGLEELVRKLFETEEEMKQLEEALRLEKEKNIDDLFKIRDEIIKSSPYLADMKLRIQFYKKAIDQIPEKENNFLSLIETPINNILSINPTNLDFTSVTGTTGSFYSVSSWQLSLVWLHQLLLKHKLLI